MSSGLRKSALSGCNFTLTHALDFFYHSAAVEGLGIRIKNDLAMAWLFKGSKKSHDPKCFDFML